MKKNVAVAPLCIFCLVFIGHTLSASAQEKARINFSEADITYISLEPHDTDVMFPFEVSTVNVIDARHDTTSLGISGSYFHRPNFIKIRKGVGSGFKTYYESALVVPGKNDTAGIEITCIVKKAILSDHIEIKSQPEGQRLSSSRFDVEEGSGILFKTEFYARIQDEYLPLCRFDTTLSGFQKVSRSGREYLEKALAASIAKLSAIDWNRIRDKAKRLRWQNIHDYNNSPFELPIFVHPPAKGIYFTFEDFLKNRPANKEFTVEKGNTGDFLYLENEKGEPILCNELWGYSDGTDMFIYSASNYFKLYRNHNGYFVYGAKDFTARRNLRANFGLIDAMAPNSNYAKSQTRTKYHLVKSFFQLDMDTGLLY